MAIDRSATGRLPLRPLTNRPAPAPLTARTTTAPVEEPKDLLDDDAVEATSTIVEETLVATGSTSDSVEAEIVRGPSAVQTFDTAPTFTTGKRTRGPNKPKETVTTSEAELRNQLKELADEAKNLRSQYNVEKAQLAGKYEPVLAELQKKFDEANSKLARVMFTL